MFFIASKIFGLTIGKFLRAQLLDFVLPWKFNAWSNTERFPAKWYRFLLMQNRIFFRRVFRQRLKNSLEIAAPRMTMERRALLCVLLRIWFPLTKVYIIRKGKLLHSKVQHSFLFPLTLMESIFFIVLSPSNYTLRLFHWPKRVLCWMSKSRSISTLFYLQKMVRNLCHCYEESITFKKASAGLWNYPTRFKWMLRSHKITIENDQ